MIGATDKASSWASSSEQLNLWFLQYGLRPWLKRIEQAIWSSLLTPVEQMKYYAEFSVEGLLRADIAGRTAFYASALQNGYLNRSTVAMLENLPAIPGGDVYTVQSNLIPLDQLGTGVESQAVRAALMHWLKEGEQ
jgi:phage portal protein BeeE